MKTHKIDLLLYINKHRTSRSQHESDEIRMEALIEMPFFLFHECLICKGHMLEVVACTVNTTAS